MFYSPIKLAIGGVIAWLVVWAITPVDVLGRVTLGALFYALVSYAALIFGAVMAQRPALETPDATQHDVWDQPLDRGLYWGTMAIGLFGMVLRLYDRLVLRGAEYGANAIEFREALETSGSTLAGIVGSVLMPLCLIPLMVILGSRDRKSKLLLAAAGLVALLPMTESLFQLSRSFLIQTLGLIFATIVITRYRGRPLNRRLIIIAMAGTLAMLFVSTVIFSNRLEANQDRLADSVFTSGYADFLQPNQAARETISSGSDAAALTTLAILPNGMYYISGVYEFGALWLRPDGQPFAWGKIHFYPFLRVIYAVFGLGEISPEEMEAYVYRAGLFQTFFGSLWADFGWIGPFFLVPFGYLAKVLSYQARAGNVAVLPIYTYLTIVIFFMPVVSFLVNGFGMLSVTAFAVFAVLASARKRAPQTSQVRLV